MGSAFPVERDILVYDRGYQFEQYDLVVTEVRDVQGTDTLLLLRMQVVEPTFEHGRVWRIPRDMTRHEVERRLARLPAVFGAIGLYFVAEHLEEARTRGDFTFELLECRGSAVSSA